MDKLADARELINQIDREMAGLWVERMNEVKKVAEYKSEHSLKVYDASREDELLKKNLEYIPKELKSYYADFHRASVEVSKRYQREALNSGKDIITLNLGERSYQVLIRRGSLNSAGEFMNLERRVLIVTDDGVPAKYAEALALQCKFPLVVTLPRGEATKCFDSLIYLLRQMLNSGFTRKDCVAAVGGGVMGDLAGFAAASYMRGIDFYNIPTTTLSQIDSSIGGKVAIDLDGYKNTVGAFWQPKFVLIDPDVLVTLDSRQTSAGLAEAVKMSLCFDAGLFEMFEQGDIEGRIDEIIRRSLIIKKNVVERDERESDIRKALNFGHTIGHGIETAAGGKLIHGECVALGMLPMCSENVRNRLLKVLKALNLPTSTNVDIGAVKAAMTHDKKSEGAEITAVTVSTPGKYELVKMTYDELNALADSLETEDKSK